jgi:hypothetical protein
MRSLLDTGSNGQVGTMSKLAVVVALELELEAICDAMRYKSEGIQRVHGPELEAARGEGLSTDRSL